MLVPFSSQASSATLLTNNTVLFTIDFSFTDELFEVQVPIVAESGIDYLDRVDTVGYTIESEKEDSTEITNVKALVLSRSNIDGNHYSLPVGTTGDFTLMILATFAEPVTENLRASITKLPYWIDDRRTTVHQNQLDELDTPTLEIAE